MDMNFRRCDMGGTYWMHHGGGATYENPCVAPVTHRYRQETFPDGHWLYRCARHATILDSRYCTIEAF
jgi:hypothetical protein